MWLFTAMVVFLLGCTIRDIPAHGASAAGSVAPDTTPIPVAETISLQEKLNRVLALSELTPEIVRRIKEDAASKAGTFLPQLEKILANDDPYLRRLVDKQHSLPADYEPDDLIELKYKSYRAGIADTMMLRRKAEAALEEMAAAAKQAGFTLTISSAYRSYQYQIGSFNRWTARLGLEQAERISARAGRSQHQLGLVVDFGSISNDFAETPAGKWVAANAGRFGFSLSYPRNYEKLTGYDWESWHFRYVGTDLAAFIGGWFGGIQQYALRFIYEWEAAK
jgi:D-alanyl-D-alanine carboxypeptidase